MNVSENKHEGPEINNILRIVCGLVMSRTRTVRAADIAQLVERHTPVRESQAHKLDWLHSLQQKIPSSFSVKRNVHLFAKKIVSTGYDI